MFLSESLAFLGGRPTRLPVEDAVPLVTPPRFGFPVEVNEEIEEFDAVFLIVFVPLAGFDVAIVSTPLFSLISVGFPDSFILVVLDFELLPLISDILLTGVMVFGSEDAVFFDTVVFLAAVSEVTGKLGVSTTRETEDAVVLDRSDLDKTGAIVFFSRCVFEGDNDVEFKYFEGEEGTFRVACGLVTEIIFTGDAILAAAETLETEADIGALAR